MNINAKILKKKWQTESNDTSEGSLTLTKLASSQQWRGGSTYANQ
jgi:hypothetical protein